MEENRLKISNPQRVARILRRICQAGLQVMIRAESSTGIAVKGRATNFVMDASQPALRISNVSEKGIAHLGSQPRVQVEFIMMSTKVVFVSSVVAREHSSILVSLPASLVSIERRKNARYSCTESLSAFLDLSVWKPNLDDLAGPPFFSFYRGISGYVGVADLSLGGLCAVTRFPAVNSVLRRGLIDERAKLILPMQTPIEVGVEVRWSKRIREHIKGKDSQSFQRYYRFGFEFVSQSEEVRIAVRQFIQQLSQAGAI